jgi:hypothetical protein
MLRRHVLAVTALAVASQAQAQMQPPKTAPAKYPMSKEYRAVQLSAIKSQRKLLLSFADSMPERLYRDKVTPAQRDFAQQVHHIVAANIGLGTAFAIGKAPSSAKPDTAAIFNSRAGLKQFINDSYDQIEAMFQAQADADRDIQVQFFGNFLPRWQVWDELNQHTFWTAGQVVANFRKHGMAPPSFLFF